MEKGDGKNILRRDFSLDMQPPSCATRVEEQAPQLSNLGKVRQIEEPAALRRPAVFSSFRSEDLQDSPVSSLMRFDTPKSVRGF